jgi:hypothetical protein
MKKKVYIVINKILWHTKSTHVQEKLMLFLYFLKINGNYNQNQHEQFYKIDYVNSHLKKAY